MSALPMAQGPCLLQTGGSSSGQLQKFVLVDIDLPLTDRTPIPADRKRRPREAPGAVRDQHHSRRSSWRHPMAGPQRGRPLMRRSKPPSRTGSILHRSRERGRRLRDALARAETLHGRPRAEALADGLSRGRPAIRHPVLRRPTSPFSARPTPFGFPTGYLAFLGGRRALDDFQIGLDLHNSLDRRGGGRRTDRPRKASTANPSRGAWCSARGWRGSWPGEATRRWARSRPCSTPRPSPNPVRPRRLRPAHHCLDGDRPAPDCSRVRPLRGQGWRKSIRPAPDLLSRGTCRTPHGCRAARHSGPTSGSARWIGDR